MTRRLCFAFLLVSLCGYVRAADDWLLTQLSNTCAEGNFLKAYAEDLKRIGLEPLAARAGVEHYRFEIAPAFSKAVLIDLRVLPDGTAEAIAYEVPWDSEPSLVPKATPKRLSRRQMSAFRRMLDQGEFWTRYYFGWGPGLDTRAWVFEGVRGTHHHFFSTAEDVPEHLGSAGTYLFQIVVGGKIPR